MKILYITPFLQHPKMPSSFRHYYFIHALSQRHEITLLTPTKSPVLPEVLEEMKTYTKQIFIFDAIRNPTHPTLGTKTPTSKIGLKLWQAQRLTRAIQDMKKTFLQLVKKEQFDLVLFHGKDVYSVIDGWNKLPIVVDFCDATSARYLGIMPYAQPIEKPLVLFRYLKARQVEKNLIKKTSQIAFISCRDREAILGATSHAKVIPNAVDNHYWQRQSYTPQPNCIMFHGGMDYRPNADAALYLIQQIVPLLKPTLTDLSVLIVGRDPLPELIEAARGNPNVTVTGAVDDIRPYLERATVYAAPLRFASGQQNKLLEAMSMQTPIVTTPVAAAGLRVVDDVTPPVVVANTPQQFAESVITLLRSKAQQAQLAVAGREYILNYFTQERSVRILEEMCLAAVNHSVPATPVR